MDDVRALRDEIVQHAHRQAQRQQQRGRPVEWQAEAQHIHYLQQPARHLKGSVRASAQGS